MRQLLSGLSLAWPCDLPALLGANPGLGTAYASSIGSLVLATTKGRASLLHSAPS